MLMRINGDGDTMRLAILLWCGAALAALACLGLWLAGVRIEVVPGSTFATTFAPGAPLHRISSNFVETLIAYSGQLVAVGVLASGGLFIAYLLGLLAIMFAVNLTNRAAYAMAQPFAKLWQATWGVGSTAVGAVKGTADAAVGLVGNAADRAIGLVGGAAQVAIGKAGEGAAAIARVVGVGRPDQEAPHPKTPDH